MTNTHVLLSKKLTRRVMGQWKYRTKNTVLIVNDSKASTNT